MVLVIQSSLMELDELSAVSADGLMVTCGSDWEETMRERERVCV